MKTHLKACLPRESKEILLSIVDSAAVFCGETLGTVQKGLKAGVEGVGFAGGAERPALRLLHCV